MALHLSLPQPSVALGEEPAVTAAGVAGGRQAGRTPDRSDSTLDGRRRGADAQQGARRWPRRAPAWSCTVPDSQNPAPRNIPPNTMRGAMSLFAKMPYDQVRDLAALTRIGNMPNIFISHPSAPFRTLKEMVAYARANPGKLSFAAGLAGTSQPLMMELFKLMEMLLI